MSDSCPIIIAGVDEAGRGALAGPVVACCAVLKKSFKLHKDVNDSKKLSEKKRYELFDALKKDIYLGVGLNSHRYINQHNILNATMTAMAQLFGKTWAYIIILLLMAIKRQN